LTVVLLGIDIIIVMKKNLEVSTVMSPRSFQDR